VTFRASPGRAPKRLVEPTLPITREPSEEFPSSTAAPCHHGRGPPDVAPDPYGPVSAGRGTGPPQLGCSNLPKQASTSPTHPGGVRRLRARGPGCGTRLPAPRSEGRVAGAGTKGAPLAPPGRVQIPSSWRSPSRRCSADESVVSHADRRGTLVPSMGFDPLRGTGLPLAAPDWEVGCHQDPHPGWEVAPRHHLDACTPTECPHRAIPSPTRQRFRRT
jgi:hypothetical protein